MSYSSIKDRLNRIATMVDGWNNAHEVSPIERDIALAELRALYCEVLDMECNHNTAIAPLPTEEPASAPVVEQLPTPAEESAVEALFDVAAPIVATTSHDDVGDAFDDALDIDALLGLSGDDPINDNPVDEPAEVSVEETTVEESDEVAEAESATTTETTAEPEAESEAKAEAETETDAEPEAESAAETEPEAESKQIGGLFDIDDIPVKSKSGRRMISLYDTPIRRVEESQVSANTTPVATETAATTPTTITKPQPKPQPKPIEVEQPQRLGDVIARDVTTLADKMAEEQPTAAFNRIQSIRAAIGLNDKFLLIRDLFDGDAALYEDTIAQLDDYTDLDECMIFIVENFQWNPDSEGAKMLVSLIERKLA